MVLRRSGQLTAHLLTIRWPLRQQQPALGARFLCEDPGDLPTMREIVPSDDPDHLS